VFNQSINILGANVYRTRIKTVMENVPTLSNKTLEASVFKDAIKSITLKCVSETKKPIIMKCTS
jgi:uncharacterized iron-regulated protein